MDKLNAAAFAAFLLERFRAGDGYIMGARGQDPKKWTKASWWFTQYSGKQRARALAWREKCERVWDCQGLAEGYINQMSSGCAIDVRARNNYAEWCDPRGKGVIPEKHRQPGAAVFKAGASGAIHHVGYLVEPVSAGKPAGDWWVVEAKGVMYGVVKTKLLSDSAWNRWGLMTRYFSYDSAPAYELGDRTLTAGCVGSDVRALQGMLIELGFSCGRCGADGDFGADTKGAVLAFQKVHRLPVTGIVDADDFEALNDGFLPDDPDEPEDEPTTYAMDCLDLSSHNGAQEPKIDWDKIKDGVGFLILRCGCTRLKTKPLGIGADGFFKKWAAACESRRVPFWAYYYSHAKTEAQAREEARFAYGIAARYHPVGYCMDCEEGTLNRAVIEAWFDEIKHLGAQRTMLYLGHNWVPVYKLPVDEDGFIAAADAIWIPRYGKNDGTAKDKYIPKYPCDLWQFSSVVSFAGIPDKTLDANRVTGQRKMMGWFRGMGV